MITTTQVKTKQTAATVWLITNFIGNCNILSLMISVHDSGQGYA